MALRPHRAAKDPVSLGTMASIPPTGPTPPTGDHSNSTATAPAPEKIVKKVVKKLVNPSKPSGENISQGAAITSKAEIPVPKPAATNESAVASTAPPKKVVKRVVKKGVEPSKPAQTTESTQQGTGVLSNTPSNTPGPAPSNNAETSKPAPPTKKVVRRIVKKAPDTNEPSAARNVAQQGPATAVQARPSDPKVSTGKTLETIAAAQVKPSDAHPSTGKAAGTTAPVQGKPTNPKQSSEKAAATAVTKAAGPSGSTTGVKAATQGQTPSASTETTQSTPGTNEQAKEIARNIPPGTTTDKSAPSTQEQQKPSPVSKNTPATPAKQAKSPQTAAPTPQGTSKPQATGKQIPAATKNQAESAGTKKEAQPTQQSRSVPVATKSNDTTLNAELRKEVVAGVSKGVNRMFDGLMAKMSK